MKIIYLDRKERVRGWLAPVRLAALVAGVLFLAFAPIWPDTVSGRFTVEPTRRAVVRTEVPGHVDRVYVQEGTVVAAGAPLLKMRDLSLESEAGRARADFTIATARATQAQLKYASYGAAERERQQSAERNRILAERLSRLTVTSPIGGVVVTPRVHDLENAFLKEGAAIAEIDDLSSSRVRIFVPEVTVRDLRLGAPADLKLDALFRPLSGKVVAIAPVAQALPEGLLPKEKYYQGFRQPEYFAATIELASSELLREGMPGTGKIQIGHRSMAGFVWRLVRDSAARKVW